jgi:hypothetical protein
MFYLLGCLKVCSKIHMNPLEGYLKSAAIETVLHVISLHYAVSNRWCAVSRLLLLYE